MHGYGTTAYNGKPRFFDLLSPGSAFHLRVFMAQMKRFNVDILNATGFRHPNRFFTTEFSKGIAGDAQFDALRGRMREC